MNFPAIPPPPGALEFRPSAIYAFFKAAPAAALACGFLWLAYHLHPAFIICSLPAMIISAYRYAWVRSIRYVLTRREIRISSGILIRRTRSVELCRVTGYAITQSLWMQLFKLMVLTLEMAGPESRAVVFRGIPACPATGLISAYVQAARLDAGGYGTQLAFNF